MSSMEERQSKESRLLTRALQGDARAFSKVESHYQGQMLTVVKKMIRNNSEAELIVKTIFKELWGKWAKYKVQEQVEGPLVANFDLAAYVSKRVVQELALNKQVQCVAIDKAALKYIEKCHPNFHKQ
jgi:hypothetical protein